MNRPDRPSRFCGLVLGLILAAPAHAEGNRLLPFWGQPYPYGYAWTRPEPAPHVASSCGAEYRTGLRHGRRRSPIEPCEVVLHARD